jgi:hypothetical protein
MKRAKKRKDSESKEEKGFQARRASSARLRVDWSSSVFGE